MHHDTLCIVSWEVAAMGPSECLQLQYMLSWDAHLTLHPYVRTQGLGMVFTSKGFGPGSTGYNLSVAVTASAIIVSTFVFLALLVFEVYRSVKYAAIHDVARQVRGHAGAGSTGSTSANA
jgi:hypothetical protein